MEVETEQDPFVSITKLCQPTASQEAKFPNCPFAREFENFADSSSDQFSSSPDPTSSDPAGIVMVSPPASISSAPQKAEDDAVFHTPPEHHLPSYFSAEDQNLDELSSDGTRTVDVGDGSDRSKTARVFERELDGRFQSKKNRVSGEEFGGETALAGETDVIVDEFEENEDAHNEAEVIVLDSTDSGEEMATSNLADDSVDAISVGKFDVVPKAGDFSKDGVPNVNGIDRRNLRSGKRCEYGEDTQVSKVKRPHENSYCCGSLDSVKCKEEIKLKYNSVNGCTKIRHGSGVTESEEVVKVIKDGKITNDGYLKINGDRFEKIDEFRYFNGGDSQKRWKERTGRAAGSFGRRRQLPVSLEGKGMNVEDENPIEIVESKSGLLDILDVLKVVVVGHMDGGCEDVDFLGTAKRRGLTFPRPRWWSAEGEDE